MNVYDDGLPPLREAIAAHGLSANKALGQNFLFDLNLTGKIARRAGDLACNESRAPSGRFVVEENPVAGVQTVRLAVVDRNPVRV